MYYLSLLIYWVIHITSITCGRACEAHQICLCAHLLQKVEVVYHYWGSRWSLREWCNHCADLLEHNYILVWTGRVMAGQGKRAWWRCRRPQRCDRSLGKNLFGNNDRSSTMITLKELFQMCYNPDVCIDCEQSGAVLQCKGDQKDSDKSVSKHLFVWKSKKKKGTKCRTINDTSMFVFPIYF